MSLEIHVITAVTPCFLPFISYFGKQFQIGNVNKRHSSDMPHTQHTHKKNPHQILKLKQEEYLENFTALDIFKELVKEVLG